MATELEKIAERIHARNEANQRDRKRQRELIRQRIAEGKTWNEVQAESKVSRPTLRDALTKPD